ncbi:MAG: hypothetical protein HUU46_19250 [Candidatus Hydrogenedentes bacterium]|nr:hypothetical protein [Candidatus Hydrogenedentota bacterium]
MTTRDLMLDIARQALLARAARDGYKSGEYVPETDHEGYVTSLLIALHHWCHAYSHDWTAELRSAQELFEEDLDEARGEEPEALSQ